MLQIPSKDVRVIPLEWFEENYLIIVDYEKNIDKYKTDHGGAFIQYNQIDIKNVEPLKVFENGKIFDVLNPSITEPTRKIKREIKLDNGWLAVSLAMLKTKFEEPQFLIILKTLAIVQNLLFYPITFYNNVEMVENQEREKS